MSDSKRSRTGIKVVITLLSVTAFVAVLSALSLVGYFTLKPQITETLGLFDSSKSQPRNRERAREEVEQLEVADVSSSQAEMVGIIAEPRVVTFDNPGESVRLTLKGYFSDGSVGEPLDTSSIRPGFSSTNEEWVSVSPDGVVSGVAAGGADVQVTYGGYTTDVPVLVFEPFEPLPAIDPERVVTIDEDGTAMVLNQLMVELEPGVGESEADSIAASIGGRVVYRFESFPAVVIENDARTEGELEETLSLLEGTPGVVSAYPDILFAPSQDPTPISSGIETLDNPKGTAYIDSGMREAWELLNTEKRNLEPVVVAIIDTEFPIQDRDRIEYYLLNEEFDADKIHVIDDIRNWFEKKVPIGDPHHGAAVTSVIAARNNSPNLRGISGVIPSVDSLPYHIVFFEVGELTFGASRAIESVSDIKIEVALDQVQKIEKGIDVVNFSMVRKGQHRRWRRAIQSNADITYVVGAGNDGVDIKKEFSPATFTLAADLSDGRGKIKAWPKLDNVITVAGTSTYQTSSDEGTDLSSSKCRVGLHPESNFGDAIVLGAPYMVLTLNTERGDFEQAQGTSYSAPLVTGTVALLKAINKDLSPSQVKDILSGTGKEVCDSYEDETVFQWKALDAGAAVKCVLYDFPKPCKTATMERAVSPTPPLPTATPTAVPPRSTPTPTATPTAVPVQPDTYAGATGEPCESPSQAVAAPRSVPPGTRIWERVIYDVFPDYTVESGIYRSRYQDVHINRAQVELYKDGEKLLVSLNQTDLTIGRRLSDYPSSYTIGLEVIDAASGSSLCRLHMDLRYTVTSSSAQSIPTGNGAPRIHIETKVGSVGKAINAVTGQEIWKFPQGTTSELYAVIDGIAYVTSDWTLFAIDLYTGEELWKRDNVYGPYLRFSEGTAYYNDWGEREEGILAFDARTGIEKKWGPEGVEGELSIFGFDEGVVYVTVDGNMSALDAANGRRLWQYHYRPLVRMGRETDLGERGSLLNAPHVKTEGNVIYVFSDDTLYAADGSLGKVNWERQFDESTVESSFISFIEADTIYVHIIYSSDSPPEVRRHQVFALDTKTGERLWSFKSHHRLWLRLVEGEFAYLEIAGKTKDASGNPIGRRIWIKHRDGKHSQRYLNPIGEDTVLANKRFALGASDGNTYLMGYWENWITSLIAIDHIKDDPMKWEGGLEKSVLDYILDATILVDDSTVYLAMLEEERKRVVRSQLRPTYRVKLIAFQR